MYSTVHTLCDCFSPQRKLRPINATAELQYVYRCDRSQAHNESPPALSPLTNHFWTHLVVDEQLDGVVAPFDEDYLIGLSGHTVGERRSYAGAGAGLEPHAHGEGVHFWEALLNPPIQVVGTEREGHLEVLRWLEGIVTCWSVRASISREFGAVLNISATFWIIFDDHETY